MLRYTHASLSTFIETVYVPTAAAGIPKFYRWLSERYPLVNQPVTTAGVPEFDNLYLDMNGIIHNCTHGNDPSTKLTESEMIVRVFNYLDHLIQIVKPQQLLFMAIDGESLDQAVVEEKINIAD